MRLPGALAVLALLSPSYSAFASAHTRSLSARLALHPKGAKHGAYRAMALLRGGEEAVDPDLNQFVQDIANGVDDGAQEAQEAARESGEAAQEAGESFSHKMSEAADQAMDAARDMAHQTEEAAERFAHKAGEMGERVGEKMEHAGEAVATELSAAYDKAEKGFEKMEAEMEKAARDHPTAARAVLAGGAFGLGDLLGQKFLSRKRRLSGRQAGGLAGFGAVLSPVFFRLCTAAFKGKTGLEIAQRVALDQLVLVPLVLVLYFSCSGLANGHAPQEVIEKLEVHLPQALGVSWLLFPAAQLLDNQLVEPKHKLASATVVMVLYSMYLSFVGGKAL